MTELTHWSAVRSGDCMTVKGKDAQGREISVHQVKRIQNGIATTKTGHEVRLITLLGN